MDKLTIEPQTCCGLKDIALHTMKIQQNDQQCVMITRPRLANKKDYLPHLPVKPLKVTV